MRGEKVGCSSSLAGCPQKKEISVKKKMREIGAATGPGRTAPAATTTVAADWTLTAAAEASGTATIRSIYGGKVDSSSWSSSLKTGREVEEKDNKVTKKEKTAGQSRAEKAPVEVKTESLPVLPVRSESQQLSGKARSFPFSTSRALSSSSHIHSQENKRKKQFPEGRIFM